MYGFVLHAIRAGCFKDFNKKMWQDISKDSGCPDEFDYNVDYNTDIFYKLVDEGLVRMRYTRSAMLQLFGKWYMRFIWTEWGMKTLGRTPGDFFRNWSDFLESKAKEYPLFTHDKFKVVSEDNEGIILEYKTVHQEMTSFCLGMIEFIVHEQFHVVKENLQITTKAPGNSDEENEEQREKAFNKSIFRIKFDNQAIIHADQSIVNMVKRGPNQGKLPNEILQRFRPFQMLKYFPFFLHFDRDLKILHVGKQLSKAFPNFVGQTLDNIFDMKQPNHGYLSYAYIVSNLHITYALGMKKTGAMESEYDVPLVIQGQMVSGLSDKSIIFLAFPIVGCFLSRRNAFYIGDLPAGSLKQTLISLMCLKNSLIEHSLDVERENARYRAMCAESVFRDMDLSNNLLNQLMPAHIHKAVRVGRPYGESCESHSNVTVLLSDMVGFTSICSALAPMEVAKMLNAMYMTFDSLLSKRKSVYKVETIGDGYMVVVGIPQQQEKHAEYAAEMAIDMLIGLKSVELPFLDHPMRVKIGLNSGPIVAGVMGWKVPRYGVFGDTVNVVNVLESTSKPNRIHISESTFNLLEATGKFLLKPRRRNSVVAKKDLNQKIVNLITQTYWLCGKGSVYISPFENETDDVCIDINHPNSAEHDNFTDSQTKEGAKTKSLKNTRDTFMSEDDVVGNEEGNVPQKHPFNPQQQWRILAARLERFDETSKICCIS